MTVNLSNIMDRYSASSSVKTYPRSRHRVIEESLKDIPDLVEEVKAVRESMALVEDAVNLAAPTGISLQEAADSLIRIGYISLQRDCEALETLCVALFRVVNSEAEGEPTEEHKERLKDVLAAYGWCETPRGADTAEQLDSLPAGTMIVTSTDEDGDVYQFIAQDNSKHPRTWVGLHTERYSERVVAEYQGPFNIVWEPEVSK